MIFNGKNFMRIKSLENLAVQLGKDEGPFVTYEEKEYIKKQLMCEYDNTSLQDENTIRNLRNLRNTVVRYFAECIQDEREQDDVDYFYLDNYERAMSKVSAVLDEMIIYKRA